MKRDMELVRQILTAVEESPDTGGSCLIPCGTLVSDREQKELAYHVDLLLEAELVKGCAEIPAVSRLTWKGHDYLDELRCSTLRDELRCSTLRVYASKP